jgi:uncharacterized phage-associated protein
MPILTFFKELLKYKSAGHNQEEAKMANVFDVARYILHKQSPMTTMKLQKLVYYCQAWSLVWDEKPLFTERIEAWASGPVVPALYQTHKGQYQIPTLPEGDEGNLIEQERKTVDAVLKAYSDKSAQWLADLTHMEQPWNDARAGYEPGMHCENEITPASMAEYYSSMPPDSDLV